MKIKADNNTPRKDTDIQVLKFDKQNIPQPYENVLNVPDSSYIQYGYQNVYPNFLLSLYNNSPIHGAIINSKGTYVIGDGLKYKDGKDITVNVNPADSYNEFILKCIADYLIFNYFAVEVTYNSFNEPVEYHHIPAHKIRTNKSKTTFWYCEDWLLKSNTTIKYERAGVNNSTPDSKIFFFDGYYPSLNTVYPSPEYNGSIKSISTDIAIRDFNLNNIKNHFSVSTLITFFNGSNVSEDVKRQVIKDIKDSYSGENGKKIIVDFQNANGKSADVRNISPNEWDKAYTVISQSVADDIYRGHQVTSPMLFGVKTEGQLGGATELETAYEIFKNTYVRGKRAELVAAFNSLFVNSTIIKGYLSFTDKALFNTQLSDALKQQVYTINELRKDAGLAPLANGDRLLNEPSQTIPVGASTTPVEDKGELKLLSEEDFDKVKHLGSIKDEFEMLSGVALQFGKQEDIARYIIDKEINTTSLNDLQADLKETGISVGKNELKGILNDLQEAGIMSVNIGKEGDVTITPNTSKTSVPNTGKINVVYDYQKRPEVSGSTIIPTSRGFCRKMVGSNKYYTRGDIQEMSRIFGYDIFKFCGGFYYNPNTDVVTPYCRHEWEPVIVRKKGA